MRKFFIMCVAALIMCTCACSSGLEYKEGKDTVYAYTNGTYQILHHNDGERETEVLMNCKYNQCVLTQIDAYQNTENEAYFIGKYYEHTVWCKLSLDDNCLYYYAENNVDDEFIMVYLVDMLKDNQIVMLSSFDEFSEEDREIFNNIET